MIRLAVTLALVAAAPAQGGSCKVGDPTCGVAAGPGWKAQKVTRCVADETLTDAANSFVFTLGARSGVMCPVPATAPGQVRASK